MNWGKIKNHSPFAHKIAMEYISNQAKQVYWHPHDRWLYDFFDIQGIQIFINRNNEWGFELWKDFVYDRQVKDWYDSRSEAEKAAFEAAFIMLEEILTPTPEEKK